MSFESLSVIFAALAIGSLAKSVTGFGLPLIAVPVMAAFLGVEHAVVVMVIPTLASNVWQAWATRRAAGAVPRLGLTLAAGVCGVAIGTWLLAALDARVLALLLAAVIGAYLGARMLRGRVALPVERLRAAAPLAVMVGGGSQGATGASGPIIVPYFHSLGLSPHAFLFAVSSVFMTFGVTQMIAIYGFGLFSRERLLEGVLALIPVALTMPVGLRLGRLVSRRAFDAAVLALLFVMGVKLAWQGIAG